MNDETLNAFAAVLPSPAGRRAGDEGAAVPHEQTIAGSLHLPLGEDRGEGAQRMAEILEA